MKVCTCVMLFGIFASTNSTIRKRTKVHRSVNPANENVPKLSYEEYSGHTKILGNVHKSIARETTASVKHKIHVFRAARTATLTGFIQDAVNILNTYEDTAFEDFFHILDPEIRKYHYRHCKFSELTQNQDTRNLLAWALKMIREGSVSSTKANINKIADTIKEETYGSDVKKLLDYINSLYTHTEHEFHRVLNELKHYRKMKSIKVHKNLIKVIRNGVRDIFFDHYTALDSNTRRELNVRIEKFWKQFKKNPASSAEVNDSQKMNDNIVSKSVISSIPYPYPEHYSKNDSQMNLRNKRDRKRKEKYYQQPQDKKTEKDYSSNESEKWNIDTDTPDEILSGQSFDSSSNSIKESQERHAEYHAERYMTLYTEQISYKSKTTKKTEIIPLTANEIAKNATVPSRPTPTFTPRYSSEDDLAGSKKVDVLRSKYIPYDIKQGISDSDHDTDSVLVVKSKPLTRATQDDDKRQKHNKSKSKSKHKNTHFIGEYNAVIDVQLTNTELLKCLGIFQPVLDSNSRYGTISYQRLVRKTKSVPTRSTIQFQTIGSEAETQSMKPALTKSSGHSKTQESIYLNRLSNTRRNKLTLLPEDDDFIRKQKQKYLTRRNANDTDLNVPKNFNEYVIHRLDTLEKDLKNFRSMLYGNHTHEAEVSNVTDKYEAKNNIENKRKDMKYNVSLKIENHDLNKKENNDGQNTRSNLMSTESSTNKTSLNLNVTKGNTINTTVIDNKNTSQFTSNHVNNKELNKDKIDNSDTTVTVNGSVKVSDSMEFEPFETTPKPTPIDYSNIRYQLDHINDGLDLHM